MKRLLLSALLILLAIASVMIFVTRPASAQNSFTFTAQLLASNEVPPVTNAEAGASGGAVVTIDVTRDAGGNITSAVTRFDVTISGLTPSSVVILAHVHMGVAGVNGPIRIDSGLSPATGLPAVNGSVSFTRTGLATTVADAQAIIANPAGWYFNAHTILNPGGVVRGQLVRFQATQPAPGTSVPTLSQWGAILMTLLVVAAGLFFLVGRGKSAALASASSPALIGGPAKAVDFKLLAKVTACVEAIIGLLLLATSAGAVDVFGALASGLVAAFIIHLLIGSARRR